MSTAEPPKIAPSPHPFWTTTQTAAHFGISRPMLANLVEQGCPYYRASPTSKTKLFDVAEVETWIRSRREVRGPRPKAAAPPEPPRPKRGAPKAGSKPKGPKRWVTWD